MNADDGDESWLSGWEQQCADDIEGQPDFEQSLTIESDNSNRKIWSIFQDSATSIAQLYRDRVTSDPGALWISFQTAAGTVTSLYKESSDGIRRSSDVAKQCGYQKRNRELLNWVKRKRALIRRDDLIAYLSGKPPPPPTRHSQHHSHRLSPRPRNLSPPPLPFTHHTLHSIAAAPDDLHTFREALARNATARVKIPAQQQQHLQVQQQQPQPPNGAAGVDLCAFIAGEFQRHCHKRPASPGSDVTMDSPTHHQKRPRYM